VLVVEDEALVSFLLEDMLRELGCADVWHAVGVREAMALLASRRPDVVLLDVNLGGELAYPLASRLDEAEVPFAFVTGYGRSGLREEWAARPVLQKPFAASALAAIIAAALSARTRAAGALRPP
jgi:DNA-binding response OmpR family regulator